MSEPNSFRNFSRHNWGKLHDGGVPKNKDIDSGSLQRIADALDKQKEEGVSAMCQTEQDRRMTRIYAKNNERHFKKISDTLELIESDLYRSRIAYLEAQEKISSARLMLNILLAGIYVFILTVIAYLIIS